MRDLNMASLAALTLIAATAWAGCVGPDGGDGPLCGDGVCDQGEPATCADCASQAASFVTQNLSSFVVREVHVSPCSAGTWGTNWLGSSTLAPGVMLTLTDVVPDCYDFLAVSTEVTWDARGLEVGPGATYSMVLTDTQWSGHSSP